MELADEWIMAYRAVERAQEKLDRITAQLLPVMAVGQELDGSKGKVRKRDRAVLQAAQLQSSISSSQWTMLTERKPVAAYYNAAIKRGKLDQKLFDACCTRSKPWLELL